MKNPDFYVRIGFVDSQGSEVDTSGYSAPLSFLHDWSCGAVKRDLILDLPNDVSPDDLYELIVEQGVLSGDRAKQGLIGNMLLAKATPVIERLRLSSTLFANTRVEEGQTHRIEARATDSDAWAYRENVVVPLQESEGYLYPPAYPFELRGEKFILPREDWKRARANFCTFLRGYLRNLVCGAVGADNEIVLYLLETAAQQTRNFGMSGFLPLSPSQFNQVCTSLEIEQTKPEILVGNADAFVRCFDLELFGSEYYDPAAAHKDLLVYGDLGFINELRVLCLGSTVDPLFAGLAAPRVFLCGGSEHLGLRATYSPLTSHSVNKVPFNQDEIGYYFWETVSTTIVDSKRVYSFQQA